MPGRLLAFAAVLAFAGFVTPTSASELPQIEGALPDPELSNKDAHGRTPEEAAKCREIQSNMKPHAEKCSSSKKLAVEEMCDESIAKDAGQLSGQSHGMVNAFQMANGWDGQGAFAQGLNAACKANGDSNNRTYKILDTVKGNCEVGKLQCEENCAKALLVAKAAPAFCKPEIEPLRNPSQENHGACKNLQAKIDKLNSQIAQLMINEQSMYRKHGCMSSSGESSVVEKPDNELHQAIAAAKQNGGLPESDYTSQYKKQQADDLNQLYANFDPISGATSPDPLNRGVHQMPPEFWNDSPTGPSAWEYPLSGTRSGSDSVPTGWSPSGAPGAPGAAPAPGPAAAAPMPSNGSFVNSDPAPSSMSPAPAMPMQQAAAAPSPANTAPKAQSSSAPTGSTAYQLAELPQTPNYDQLADTGTSPDPNATDPKNAAAGTLIKDAVAVTADSKTEDSGGEKARSSSVSVSSTPMQQVQLVPGSGGLKPSSGTAGFVNDDPSTDSASGGQGGKRRMASAAGSESPPSGGGKGRLSSWVSSWFGGDDKPASASTGSSYWDNKAAPANETAQVDLRQFLPGERIHKGRSSIAGMNPLRQQGIHGSETILWNALQHRYRALEDTLLKEP